MKSKMRKVRGKKVEEQGKRKKTREITNNNNNDNDMESHIFIS